ncbi:citrate lyase [Paraburkholderia ginsengiterrae]|uniref:Citrate lyase n=1 Tax=Paraburkholderia ginsengiterrae TaxID=1462993 RepID=A0A1A9N292_9BURK|nr:CoA ester lyase [Paraburkholderia ginsengiterrae]OAJ56003.1 citrate lyase [Paraburkholderia ginsengiterrae]OAJ58541.1 citrate lyase [Paraburkholderia ginsengiterrae]
MNLDRIIRARRSFIFAPGNRPDMFSKALACGTDIVCVDLEDAIAPHEKEVARANAFEHLPKADGPATVERVIRINCLRTVDGMKDVQRLLDVEASVDAIMLPKVKGPEEVRNLSDLMDEFKATARLHVIIETNEGLEAASEIARSSDRVEALFFGGVDMAADLRCRQTWSALLYARSRVVHAAAMAGVDAIDVPYLDLSDIDGMRREADLSAELGFTGKGAIHPKQIPHINAAFMPDESTVAYARRVLDAFEKCGAGLLVFEGKLIEKPVIRSFARMLAVHDVASRQ